MNNTTNEWTEQKGIPGRLFTAKNGQTLFLPAAGCMDDEGFTPGYGCYSSNSLYSDCDPSNETALFFGSNYFFLGEDDGRCVGHSVRAVRKI